MFDYQKNSEGLITTKINIENDDHNAVIDSGAVVSAVSEQFFSRNLKNFEFKNESEKILTANQQELDMKGVVQLEFKINNN